MTDTAISTSTGAFAQGSFADMFEQIPVCSREEFGEAYVKSKEVQKRKMDAEVERKNKRNDAFAKACILYATELFASVSRSTSEAVATGKCQALNTDFLRSDAFYEVDGHSFPAHFCHYGYYGYASGQKHWKDRAPWPKTLPRPFVEAQKALAKKNFQLLDVSDPTKGRGVFIILVPVRSCLKAPRIKSQLWHGLDVLPSQCL
jgi:hypothetical protein